jgi:hypothetical protein
MCPIRPNVLWALDFQFDTLANGRTIKMLNVIDEFTREALAIEVDHSIDADGSCRSRPPHCRTWWRSRVPADGQRPRTSSRTPLRTGADSTTPPACSSIPAHHGRTPGSSRSTAVSATNSSTVALRQPPRSPSNHRGLADRLQHGTDPIPPTATSPQPSSPATLDHHQPTPSRITTGPLKRVPLTSVVRPRFPLRC